jgi:hypothetical protein
LVDEAGRARRFDSSLARHANKSVTDDYSKVKEGVAFRKKVAEQVGIGFALQVEAPAPQTEVAPNCAQSELSARNV